MIDLLLYIVCGLTAGLLGGYLGIGGGIVIVPFLTVLMKVPIDAAVPISMTAILANSLSASGEYLKKGLVDMPLVVVLTLFMMLGNIAGSLLSFIVPELFTRGLLVIIMVYTSYSLFTGKQNNSAPRDIKEERASYTLIMLLALVTGVLGALVGVGGGIIMVPVLYLYFGVPMAVASGTSSFIIGFGAAASASVYFLKDRIELGILVAVISGVLLGGRLGGFLGTKAKPKIVKLIFAVLLLYMAYQMASSVVNNR